MSVMPWLAPSPRSRCVVSTMPCPKGSCVGEIVCTHCHCMGGIPYQRDATFHVVPHALLWQEIFQNNRLRIRIFGQVHHHLLKRFSPSFSHPLHQRNLLLAHRWDIQRLFSAHISLPIRPTQYYLQLVCVRVFTSCIIGRCVQEGEVHEGIRLRVATLEKEWV